MAATIRIGHPIIRTGIVNVDAGVAGGDFVTLDELTGKITLNASTYDTNTYIVINVVRDQYISDDATAKAAKGDLVNIIHPLVGDEVTITGITGDKGDIIRDNFQIVDSLLFNGLAAKALRRIETA